MAEKKNKTHNNATDKTDTTGFAPDLIADSTDTTGSVSSVRAKTESLQDCKDVKTSF